MPRAQSPSQGALPKDTHPSFSKDTHPTGSLSSAHGCPAKTGYEPAAAVTLWDKMRTEDGGAGILQFLNTHPNPDNRAARLAIQADQLRNHPPPRPPQPYPVRIHP